MRGKRLVGACAVACGVGMLVACSSSTSKTVSTSSGSSRPASWSSPASTSPSAAPASLAQLKKIVLQLADLPPGWKGTPYQSDSSDAADQAALVKCFGARSTDGGQVAEANSEDFALGDATISSSADSYGSQADVDTDVAILHSPKASSCFNQVMKKAVATSKPAGATIESESIKLTPGSAHGPANVAGTLTTTVKFSVNGQQVPLYAISTFITGPLIEAEVDTSNIGAPVPASVVNALVATVATRAAKG